MPPKKNDGSDADTGSGEGTWKWTLENERTLLLLILGRGTLGKADHEKIATALSPNVNWNGVRQRIGKFRSEQKKMFEDLGWDVADTPAKTKAPATPRKRKMAGEEGEGEGDETPSKANKGRAKKVKSEERVVDEEEEDGGEVGVKEERV